MTEDDLLSRLTIIKISLTERVESKYVDKNRKFAIEKLNEVEKQVKKLNIDDVSNCIHPFKEVAGAFCNKCKEYL